MSVKPSCRRQLPQSLSVAKVGVLPLVLLVLTVVRSDAERVGPLNALQLGAILIALGVIVWFFGERVLKHDHR